MSDLTYRALQLEVAAATGCSRPWARRLIEATVTVVGRHLRDDLARAMADELPSELRSILDGLEYLHALDVDGVVSHVAHRLDLDPRVAGPHVYAVGRALAGALSPVVLARVPSPLAPLFGAVPHRMSARTG